MRLRTVVTEPRVEHRQRRVRLFHVCDAYSIHSRVLVDEQAIHFERACVLAELCVELGGQPRRLRRFFARWRFVYELTEDRGGLAAKCSAPGAIRERFGGLQLLARFEDEGNATDRFPQS